MPVPNLADPVTTPTLPLLLRVLGPIEISWLGRPLVIARRQARALLLRLATHLQPLARNDLLFLFWPDAREAVARRNLSHLLTHLRRALPQPDLLQLTDDAKRMRERIQALEAILDAEHPNWREK